MIYLVDSYSAYLINLSDDSYKCTVNIEENVPLNSIPEWVDCIHSNRINASYSSNELSKSLKRNILFSEAPIYLHYMDEVYMIEIATVKFKREDWSYPLADIIQKQLKGQEIKIRKLVIIPNKSEEE